jgi:hypothetical protein
MRVATTVKGPNKTQFVTEYLQKNPTANPAAVREAWTTAGQPGSVSVTLVNKLRAELGLTGNLRGMSRAKVTSTSKGPKSRARAAKKKASGNTRAQSNGATALTKAGRPSDRDRVLREMEGELDRLIFTLMAIGGMEKVEDALRSVRRVVVRSHKA